MFQILRHYPPSLLRITIMYVIYVGVSILLLKTPPGAGLAGPPTTPKTTQNEPQRTRDPPKPPQSR